MFFIFLFFSNKYQTFFAFSPFFYYSFKVKWKTAIHKLHFQFISDNFKDCLSPRSIIKIYIKLFFSVFKFYYWQQQFVLLPTGVKEKKKEMTLFVKDRHEQQSYILWFLKWNMNKTFRIHPTMKRYQLAFHFFSGFWVILSTVLEQWCCGTFSFFTALQIIKCWI